MVLDVKKLAKLANVMLTDSQEKDLEESIPAVVEYMDQVKNLNIDSIKETNRIGDEVNITREDVVTKSLTQEEALNGAKNYKGFFIVPNIIKVQK